LASGIAGLSSKLFREICPEDENLQFQAILFLTAFALTTLPYYRRKARTELRALQWGAALGTVNLGSSLFMVLTLTAVAGTLAFPVSAALEVAVIAVLGRVVWKEPLPRRVLIGLALTAAALVLVNLPG
jgi:drug/metabolite transporter (DMT)-like permease